jgi:hypothetical protein
MLVGSGSGVGEGEAGGFGLDGSLEDSAFGVGVGLETTTGGFEAVFFLNDTLTFFTPDDWVGLVVTRGCCGFRLGSLVTLTNFSSLAGGSGGEMGIISTAACNPKETSNKYQKITRLEDGNRFTREVTGEPNLIL